MWCGIYNNKISVLFLIWYWPDASSKINVFQKKYSISTIGIYIAHIAETETNNFVIVNIRIKIT